MARASGCDPEGRRFDPGKSPQLSRPPVCHAIPESALATSRRSGRTFQHSHHPPITTFKRKEAICAWVFTSALAPLRKRPSGRPLQRPPQLLAAQPAPLQPGCHRRPRASTISSRPLGLRVRSDARTPNMGGGLCDSRMRGYSSASPGVRAATCRRRVIEFAPVAQLKERERPKFEVARLTRARRSTWRRQSTWPLTARLCLPFC